MSLKTNEKTLVPGTSQVAKPVHIQRLEKSLDLSPFFSYFEQTMNNNVDEEEDEVQNEDSASSSDEYDQTSNSYDFNLALPNVEEVHIDKSKLYNFSNVKNERQWLQNVLLETSNSSIPDSSDEITEEDYYEMLRHHVLMKKYRTKYYNDPDNARYQYYSAGILSNYDKYPEHQKTVSNVKKRKREREKRNEKKIVKRPAVKSKETEEVQDDSNMNYNLDWEDEMSHMKEELDDGFEMKNGVLPPLKKKSPQKNPEVMAARRRKVWIMMCKKEIGKVQRSKANNHKEVLVSCKKTAQLCMRSCRQKAMQSQKNMKETLWRMKRLTREMQSYWKRFDRVEREMRRRMEKEAEEQRKMDVEIIEAKRQQRKLNFLITQTELYAHFMSRKLGKASPEEQLRILNQLDEEKNPRLASIDDYDCEVMKAKAKRNAKDAFTNERVRTKLFDLQANSSLTADLTDEFDLSDTKSTMIEEEHPQPMLFQGNLKGYQLRGMNWLANLYDQGISGILADEMGLGKTVQSIAFLCHIAEKYSVWGPFLIISPASTLHNWQQEMERFVPSFKVVPYWGNPNERKILRQFLDKKDMHTKDASFHVVITSYQIVITDFKYFNRIKWQYMILDEAQAIKSTSSVRWKMLLGFSCRNRLLLSGTPIQNSMAELWALLHFIMPTLFDSHDEFNEWFSKDIESHAENKTGIDEKHLSRLHMILKPFMLRRIKKDVENELSDKIEIMVYCPLTTRQKLLYMALKKKIRIEDLLHYTISGGNDSHTVDRNFTSNLMNLVMQFRKVCNHPELFERRDAKSALYVEFPNYELPKLIYENGVLYHAVPSLNRILYNLFYIFCPENIRESLRNDENSIFSFLTYLNISPSEVFNIMMGNLIYRWKHSFQTAKLNYLQQLRRIWKSVKIDRYTLMISSEFRLSFENIKLSHILEQIIFTAVSERDSTVYTHSDHTYHSMAETLEHRMIRSRMRIHVPKIEAVKPLFENDILEPLLDELPYIERPSEVLDMQRTDMPRFLYNSTPKVQCKSIAMYCDSRKAQWDLLAYTQLHSWQGLLAMWNECCNIDDYEEKCKTYLVHVPASGGMEAGSPLKSWSNIIVPDKETLVTDAGKLSVLDGLLKRLKEGGHRVLIYSQMTKMIDLLEEYMWHRKHKYMRLDGSSKISERRDMVADFQARTDIFVFLLSTRAGGLGINLTAADTVIFYDSDWNPTVDQQAMDRAHRLGQTKQVTVYRLICKGSIEERILQRAREKSEIQRMVISGGNFKPDTLKPKEVVSLLLDDEEIETKYRQRTEERKQAEEQREREKERERERKRKHMMAIKSNCRGFEFKKSKFQENDAGLEDVLLNVDSCPPSPSNSDVPSEGSGIVSTQDDTSNEALVVDLDPSATNSPLTFTPPYGSSNRSRTIGRGQSKRGRPRGSRRSLAVGRSNAISSNYTSGGDSTFETTQSSLTCIDSPSSLQPQTQPHSQSQLHSPSQSQSHSPRGGSPVAIRRGPGRPRLKPGAGGPANQGVRGISRPRKPTRPLPVPIRSGSSSTHTTPPSSSSSSVTTFTDTNYCFYESNVEHD